VVDSDEPHCDPIYFVQLMAYLNLELAHLR
jgi:hypothetical protein